MKLGLQLALWVELLSCGAWLRVGAQNPMEQLATGGLQVGQKLLSSMQEGSMFGQEMSVESAPISARSATAVGTGNAIRRPGSDDSEESYERRRRRRRRRSGDHLALHRIKRSPCWNMMGATTESGDDLDERRRARKRAANNRTRSRISKPTTKKKLQEAQRRRRRQAVQEDQPLGPSLGQRVTGMWLAFVDNVTDVMQQMRDKIKGAAAQAHSGAQP